MKNEQIKETTSNAIEELIAALNEGRTRHTPSAAVPVFDSLLAFSPEPTLVN